jgi:hypothetical protein
MITKLYICKPLMEKWAKDIKTEIQKGNKFIKKYSTSLITSEYKVTMKHLCLLSILLVKIKENYTDIG